MSGVIAATVVVGVGTALYTTEEARRAKSDADERLKTEKIAYAGERDFANKKKANNDALASTNALRLRENLQNGNSGNATQVANQNANLGVLGLV